METDNYNHLISSLLAENDARIAGRDVLALVSGGVDSCVMVSIIAQLAHGPRSITVLHLDHGYRSNTPEAASELAAAKNIAERHNLKFVYVKRDFTVDVCESSSKQADSRQWRYNMALKAAKDHGCTHILTGHSASDNTENALMHMIGSIASPAMTARAKHPTEPALLIVRPLLALTREQIVAYAHINNIQWSDDPTNIETETYVRNAIRHNVVPALTEIDPQLGRVVAKHAMQQTAMKKANHEMAAALLFGMLRPDGILRDSFDHFSIEVREAIIAAWLADNFPDNRSFNSRTVTLVANLAPGKKARINSEFEVIATKFNLTLTKSAQVVRQIARQ